MTEGLIYPYTVLIRSNIQLKMIKGTSVRSLSPFNP